MKLLGYEVRNYGAFEEQFVPLDPGIIIVAGLNNAGKTSLLKALAAFKSNPPSLPYIHSNNESMVCLIYAIDSSDLPQINANANVPFVTPDSGFIARANFAFKDPRFMSIELLAPDTKSYQWYFGPSSQLQKSAFDAQGQAISTGVIFRKQTNLTFLDFESILPGIKRVTEALYVPARREGSGQNPANANTELPLSGSNLASYLFTLQINNTDEYEILNGVFCAVFPYLKRVNAQINNNQVEVRVTYKDNDQVVPLSACGTGVEQLLILLTCIMRSPEDAIIAIDEPHSFLHPSAERALVRFLGRYPKKTIILATHSAIMVNAVSPERIVYISRKGRPTVEVLADKKSGTSTNILAALGYENSDILFHNKLIFVEGPTESAVLPKMLQKSGVAEETVSWIGTPQLEGANPVRDEEDLAKQIRRYEKLITSLGRGALPRLYLLDGDRDVKAVQRMSLNEHARAVFLKKPELENYILDPSAISKAIVEDAKSQDVDVEMTAEEVQLIFDKAIADGLVKGSDILAKVYASKLIRYSKVNSSQLIVKHLPGSWEPLAELRTELQDFLNQNE